MIRTLAGYASGEAVDPDLRLRAIGMLLDRGYGKPASTHTGEDGEGPLEIIVRQIIETRK